MKIAMLVSRKVKKIKFTFPSVLTKWFGLTKWRSNLPIFRSLARVTFCNCYFFEAVSFTALDVFIKRSENHLLMIGHGCIFVVQKSNNISSFQTGPLNGTGFGPSLKSGGHWTLICELFLRILLILGLWFCLY